MTRRAWRLRTEGIGLDRLLVGVVAAITLWVSMWVGRIVVDTGQVGLDYSFYRDLAMRWLATGEFYAPHQLAGPYVAVLTGQGGAGDNLYPPAALILFVPFAYLPAIVWWAVPIAVTLYVIRDFRPSPLGVCVMLALLAWPRAIGAYWFGNTDIWAVAGVAGGLRWGWPAMLLLIKPTLAPIALVGARHRSFWLAIALLLVFLLVSYPMWLDYATAISNVSVPWSYSLGSLPLLLIPLVARFAAGEGQSPIRLQWRRTAPDAAGRRNYRDQT